MRAVLSIGQYRTCLGVTFVGWMLGAAPAFAQTPDEAAASAILVALCHEQGLTPKDLVDQAQAKNSIDAMVTAGWRLPAAEATMKRLLPESDFLVRSSKSTAGRAFFRRLATMDHGWDRVDRIRNMPMGEQRIAELIRGPDGYKMIDYLADTSWGKNMGRQLARAQGGADFNKPTGRIYTVEDFASSAAKGAQRPKPPARY